jgi:hypothetical protein
MGEAHPILSALQKAGAEDNDDGIIPASGGDPWYPEADWRTLATTTDPNYMEVTEEAVKCYKLNEDTDIVDNRLYIQGEGKPTISQMMKIQAEVDALKGKPLPGVPMGDVETAISYFVGLSLGFLLIAVVTYYILNFAFINRIDGAYTDTLWNRFVNLMTKWFCPPSFWRT